MSGYLEGYGEVQARRSRKLRWLILTPLLLLVVGTVLYFRFRDYREYRAAKQFVEYLQQQDYRAAYSLWGCTEHKPCPHYSYESFLEDWGPNSPFKNAHAARIADTKGCTGGVITVLRAPGQQDVQLWVDRRSGEIGFAPWRLKEVPPGFRTRLAAWMWSITRNCDPLVAP